VLIIVVPAGLMIGQCKQLQQAFTLTFQHFNTNKHTANKHSL